MSHARCRGLVTQGVNGRHLVQFDCLQLNCPSHCKQDYEKLPLDKWLYWDFFELVQTIGQTPRDWKQWGSLVLTFAKPLKQLYIRQEDRKAWQDRQAKAARADGLKPTCLNTYLNVVMRILSLVPWSCPRPTSLNDHT